MASSIFDVFGAQGVATPAWSREESIFRAATNGGGSVPRTSSHRRVVSRVKGLESADDFGITYSALCTRSRQQMGALLCGAGVEESRSRSAMLASQVQPKEQFAHILVRRGIRQLEYRAFCKGEQRVCLLARLNASHSCVVQCQGTNFGGVVAHTVLPAFPLCFSNWFGENPRASRDRASVKGGASKLRIRRGRRGASNIKLAGVAVAPSLHFDCCSQCSKSIASKIFHVQKSN